MALLALVAMPAASALAAPPSITISEPPGGSFTRSRTPLFSGTTNAPLGGFVTLDIYSGSVTGGSPVQQQFALPFLEGTWEITPEPLEQGEYTAVAEQTIEGEAGRAEVTFTVDTTKPVVTLNAVPTPSKDSTPTLSGDAGEANGDDGNIELTVHAGATLAGAVVEAGPVPVESGGWSHTVAELADGTYTALASQEDAAGNLGTSKAVTFTVDTTAPAVTLTSMPPWSNNATPTLTGGAGSAPGDHPHVTVIIYHGSAPEGSVAQTGEVTPTGSNWSFTAAHLSDGEYTARATQSDEAGNVGLSATTTFTIDTVKPLVTINALAPASNNPTPTLSGSAGTLPGDHPTVTLTIFKGKSSGGKAVVVETVPVIAGTWTYTSAHLADGTYTAEAAQSDEAGNLGASSSAAFTIDTVKPAVTLNTLTSPTKNPKPTLSGAGGTESGDAATVTVKIVEGASASGAVAASGNPTVTAGAWSFTSPHLADGVYTAIAEQADDAGNLAISRAVTFTVDTTPPLVAITVPAAGTLAKVSTLTFSGSSGQASGDEAVLALRIYSGTTPTGTPVQTVSPINIEAGAWSTNAVGALADGTYTAVAEQLDAAGNVGMSTPVTFTIDTTAPKVSLTSPAAGELNVSQPTFGGAAGEASGDLQTVVLKIYAGEGTGGSPLNAVNVAAAGGSWTTGSSGPHLADGTYTVIATQSDEAGNLGASKAVTFTIDTVAPKVTMAEVPSPGNNPTPTLTGARGTETGDSSSVKVTIFAGSAPSGTIAASGIVPAIGSSWSFTAPHLLDGTYTAIAEQSDAAGNLGTSTPPRTFVIDTVKPVVTLNPVAVLTNDPTPTFTGTGGVASGDDGSVVVKIYEGSEAAGTIAAHGEALLKTGAWSFTSPHLADGTYTVIAEQSDAAGNLGTSKKATFTIDSTPPIVSLLTPAAGPTNVAKPTFSGSAGELVGDEPSIAVNVYAGAAPAGTPAETLTATAKTGAWSTGASGATLADGTYTAIAEQSDDAGNLGVSAAVTFRIDTVKPKVTMAVVSTPSKDAAPTLSGAAGTEPGDSATVAVSIYEGSATSGAVAASGSEPVNAGGWSFAVAHLADGTYTAQATQEDEAGNVGKSAAVTFTIDTTPPVVAITTPANDAGLNELETDVQRARRGTPRG